jgi:hypothetical protein
MKRMIMISMLLHVAFNCVTAEETGLVHQVQLALRQAEYAVPEQHRSLGYFTENYRAQGGWHFTPEFAQLQELVSENWREVLDNIVEITGDSKVHQLMLCASFFSLPEEDFFFCLNRIADLCLADALPKLVFGWTRGAYELHTKPIHRFALHYDDPTVIEILRKAKIMRPKERAYYNKILSGGMKRWLTSPFYYDNETGTEPNLYSAESWAMFLGYWIIRMVVFVAIIIGAVVAWRYFRKQK